MKRLNKWVAILGLVAFAAAPAIAGDYEKCDASTQECLDKMSTYMQNHGWIGIEGEKVDSGGWEVTKVIPGSPAEEAGLRSGDVLITRNELEISEANEEAIHKALGAQKEGHTVDYTVKRDGYDRQITVTVGPMPADVLAKYVGEHMLKHASAGMGTGK